MLATLMNSREYRISTRGTLIALGSVIVLSFIRYLIERTFHINTPFSLFFISTILSAGLGGFATGLFSTFLAIVVHILFLRASLVPQPIALTITGSLIYLIDGVLISAVCSALRRRTEAERDLRVRATASEERVAESGRALVDQFHWLELVLNKTEAAIVLVDPKSGDVVFTNDAARKMTGGVATNVSQYSDQFQFFDENGVLLEKDQWPRMRAIRGETIEGEKFIWKTPSGTWDYMLYAGVIPASYGRDQTVIISLVNITELRETERLLKHRESELEEINANLERAIRESTKELREAYNFSESVLEFIPNMIFVKDAKDLRFLRFNRAGEDLLGLKREVLLGKNDFDFFPAAEAELFKKRDREVLEGNVVVDIPEETVSTSTGIKILHTKKIPILDESGKPKYLIGVSEDITDRTKFEQERLQLVQAKIEKQESDRASERFNFLARASAVLSSSLDLESTLTNLTKLCVPTIADWCSVHLVQPDKTLKQLAVAHSDPEKVKWAWELNEKFPPDQNATTGAPNVARTGRPEFMPSIEPSLLEAAAVSAEHKQIIDSIGFQSYICAALRVRGEIIGTLTLVTTYESNRLFTDSDLRLSEDLCSRAGIAVDNARLYREAQTLNRVKDEFLATLSHELRTPINVIQGHADLIMSEFNEIDDASLKESLVTIQRNTRLQTQIVSDLLDVSSIITGKISYVPQELDASDVVLAVVNAIKPTGQAKGVEVLADIASDQKSIMADPTRLHQILWNLVNNAVKFTPTGGRVTVSVRFENAVCVFNVTDTGIGIPKPFLPLVFERFSQADSSMSRRYGGLGLGLSIVKNLVEIHGGTVSVTSEGKGTGSSFTVRLPIHTMYSYSTPSLEIDARIGTKTDEEAKSLEGVKILLVEDSPDNRMLVTRMLKKAGAHVSEAESPVAARHVLESFTPDIILSDIGMPGENGLQFMKTLREQTKFAMIPAIALTAYVRPEEIDEALAAGFQAHVSKPVTRPSLINEIARVRSEFLGS